MTWANAGPHGLPNPKQNPDSGLDLNQHPGGHLALMIGLAPASIKVLNSINWNVFGVF
jgi:hypothetical protein